MQAADKPDQAEQDSAKSKSAADADQGKSKADKDKSEAGKEAASDESEGGKEGMNPEENVPVRLESEPLEEPGSPKGAEALEDQKPTAAQVGYDRSDVATYIDRVIVL